MSFVQRPQAQKTTTTQQTVESEAVRLANLLTSQLIHYKELREAEKTLRLRVHYLENIAAYAGPLKLEVDQAILLQAEAAKLEQVRGELNLLTSQLEVQQNIRPDERAEIQIARLGQLISDIKAKREQVTIYQCNVNYLEELQPQLGVAAGLDFINALRLTRQQLGKIQGELRQLEQKIKVDWRLDSAAVEEITNGSEDQIIKFVRYNLGLEPKQPATVAVPIDVALRQQERAGWQQPSQDQGQVRGVSLQSLKLRREAQQQYEPVVKDVLQQLTRDFFPDCSYDQWKISNLKSEKGKDIKVSVMLVFDGTDNPVGFSCSLFNGIETKANSHDLSQASLMQALITMLGAEGRKRRMLW